METNKYLTEDTVIILTVIIFFAIGIVMFVNAKKIQNKARSYQKAVVFSEWVNSKGYLVAVRFIGAVLIAISVMLLFFLFLK